MTLILFEVSLQVLGLGVTFFTNRDNETAITQTAGKKIFKILVLGESTSYGMLLKNRLQDAYPYQVAKFLKDKRRDIDFQVINLSYPGQTSYSIANTLERNLKKYKPNLVICHFGVNDSDPVLNPFLQLKFYHLSIPTFIKKIKTFKLITLSYLYFKNRKNISQGLEGQFIFENRALNNGQHDFSYVEESKKTYHQILSTIKSQNIPYLMLSYFHTYENIFTLLASVQKENNAHYVNLKLKDREKLQDLYAEDLWHPSIKGHTHIARKIIQLLKENTPYFFKALQDKKLE
mgnify:CR=1 FL=1